MKKRVDTPVSRKAFEDPCYRKSRLAARLLIKKHEGKLWKAREATLASRLANDPEVSNRLIGQALIALRYPRTHELAGIDEF